MDPDLKAAQKELDRRVMGKAGITGTAIGQKAGRPCLKVYVVRREAAKGLPRSLAGFPVDVEVTGPIRPS